MTISRCPERSVGGGHPVVGNSSRCGVTWVCSMFTRPARVRSDRASTASYPTHEILLDMWGNSLESDSIKRQGVEAKIARRQLSRETPQYPPLSMCTTGSLLGRLAMLIVTRGDPANGRSTRHKRRGGEATRRQVTGDDDRRTTQRETTPSTRGRRPVGDTSNTSIEGCVSQVPPRDFLSLRRSLSAVPWSN
jgi:hypothetical protein